MIFRALTFNMQNGQPWDSNAPDHQEIDLEQTVAFLRKQDADVVFLQEVEEGFDGGLQIQPPPNYAFLRDRLADFDSVFAYPEVNDTEIPFGLGLAIFSRSKLCDYEKRDLPPGGGEFEYGGIVRRPSSRLLIAATTVIHGRKIRLLNTHLQAFFMIGSTSIDQPAQRLEVERLLRSQTGPTILAGDFNCAPGEGLVKQFAEVGFQTAQNQLPTWRRMPFALDHLFFNHPLQLGSHRVISTSASDHHAVSAEFSFL